MAVCEQCWTEACAIAARSVEDTTEVYARLISAADHDVPVVAPVQS